MNNDVPVLAMDVKNGLSAQITLSPRAHATTLAVVHRAIWQALVVRPENKDPNAFPVNTDEGRMEINVLAESILQKAIDSLRVASPEMQTRFVNAVHNAVASSMGQEAIDAVADRINLLKA